MKESQISKNPFASELREYVQEEKTFYCMPGHKQGVGAPTFLKNIWGEKVFSYDITEVNRSDVLAYPKKEILHAQKRAASIMGAARTWFLVNGSSVGIHAILGALVKPGEKVLVHRECHKAVLMGLVFSGAVPIYLEPVPNLPEWAYGSVDIQKVEELLVKHEIKLVLVTSPNYYGISLDISRIAEICHEHEALLFVDEAHGTHFSFHDRFPTQALRAGADYVVQSMHKTLGGLYQTALLHSAGNSDFFDERVDNMLSMLQSTSPSALFLMSIDAALTEVHEKGEELYGNLIEMLDTLRSQLNNSKFGVVDPPDGILAAGNFVSYDPCKIIFRSISMDEVNLIELKDALSESYGIEIELAEDDHMLLTLSLADAMDLEKTKKNLIRFSDTIEKLFTEGVGYVEEQDDFVDHRELPIFELTPRDAFYSPKVRKPISEAVHEISASMVCIYPPGYPLIIPGERINEAAIHTIYHDHGKGFTIIGITEDADELYIDIIEEPQTK
ncbi:MAG: aminotransferase class I/II-fold pyridoxal phosphate-dependent enzyme [Sphaerochaetaceae bacterium]|nr:aminotransferase class I/II-fold pyridoxal phosphate-dependent enzyme [Sphaerochaetaceae bacterium]